MEDFRSIAQKMLNEVTDSLGRTNARSFVALVEALSKRRTIVVSGEGGAGGVARSFAHALARLGRNVHVVGESTSPGVRIGDLLVVLTESGTSALMVERVAIARRLAATVAVITADGHAPLLAEADVRVILPAPARTPFSPESVPGNTSLVFTEAALLYLNAVVRALTGQMSRHDIRDAGTSLD